MKIRESALKFISVTPDQHNFLSGNVNNFFNFHNGTSGEKTSKIEGEMVRTQKHCIYIISWVRVFLREGRGGEGDNYMGGSVRSTCDTDNHFNLILKIQTQHEKEEERKGEGGRI